jgi:hypothetical protein
MGVKLAGVSMKYKLAKKPGKNQKNKRMKHQEEREL